MDLNAEFEKEDDDDIASYEPEEKGDKVIELEEALKHVSKFFLYHADQRLKTFRYFLFYLAAVCVGFYSAFNNKHYFFLAIGSIASLTITIVFWCLETRNRQLLKIGYDACKLMGVVEKLSRKASTNYECLVVKMS